MALKLRSLGAKLLSSWLVPKRLVRLKKPEIEQEKIFRNLISNAKNTAFGREHNFDKIQSYEDFKKNVPLRDYEQLAPYIERIIAGENDVLWRGKPIYFAKTSGTTSGTKYIPITKDSIPNHINSARDALLFYVHQTGNADFLDRNLIFLSGSPVLEHKGGIHTGRLSGIVNHHVPAYLRSNQKPSFETNCIEDWEEKLDKITEETLKADMSLISGIPPWVQMYFDRLNEKTGKSISEIFPNFSLFVYGGVNFAPYKAKIFRSIGKKIDSIETFPASEGFFAFQNDQNDESLLLLCDSGIFFEFVPAEEIFSENPTRLSVADVEIDKVYALVINSNAGLWGYVIGDLVKFTQKNPHKILFAGRAKHYTSAFGEHVIAEEVEKALAQTSEVFPEMLIREFTVAPVVSPEEGLPHHEWLIAFDNPPHDIESFARRLDENLRKLNAYYDDLISGNILRTLKIRTLPPDAFITYMKSLGKLGGQNKVPRLSNDYKMADAILKSLKFFPLILLFFCSFFAPETLVAQQEVSAERNHSRVKEAKAYAEETWQKIFREKKMNYPPDEIFTRIFKEENEMEVWVKQEKDEKFTLVKTFDICRMSGVPGPKRRQGDLQVPEGLYELTQFNPNSNFFLSMLVSYPNASDRYFSKRQGFKDPGGEICIHGHCVSIGCIAIEDQIKEYYWLCFKLREKGKKFFPVHIFPFKLDKILDEARKERSGDEEVLKFWKNIEPAFDYFEKHKKLPKFRFGNEGEYIFDLPSGTK